MPSYFIHGDGGWGRGRKTKKQLKDNAVTGFHYSRVVPMKEMHG